MTVARKTRRTPTNVSIRPELVARAKELGLNLSGLLESAVEQAIRAAERERWLEENKEGFDAYNAFVAKHGLFSDQWRKF